MEQKTCISCRQPMPAGRTARQCQPCFDKWKDQMKAEGKWREEPKGRNRKLRDFRKHSRSEIDG